MSFDRIVEILRGLQSAGWITDFAYHHFKSSPTLPFVAYLENDLRPFYASNTVFYKEDSFRVELYSANKDLSLERALELALVDEIWSKDASVWLETENCYMTVYTVN